MDERVDATVGFLTAGVAAVLIVDRRVELLVELAGVREVSAGRVVEVEGAIVVRLETADASGFLAPSPPDVIFDGEAVFVTETAGLRATPLAAADGLIGARVVGAVVVACADELAVGRVADEAPGLVTKPLFGGMPGFLPASELEAVASLSLARPAADDCSFKDDSSPFCS